MARHQLLPGGVPFGGEEGEVLLALLVDVVSYHLEFWLRGGETHIVLNGRSDAPCLWWHASMV